MNYLDKREGNIKNIKELPSSCKKNIKKIIFNTITLISLIFESSTIYANPYKNIDPETADKMINQIRLSLPGKDFLYKDSKMTPLIKVICSKEFIKYDYRAIWKLFEDLNEEGFEVQMSFF
jgi:hypothetical protein